MIGLNYFRKLRNGGIKFVVGKSLLSFDESVPVSPFLKARNHYYSHGFCYVILMWMYFQIISTFLYEMFRK